MNAADSGDAKGSAPLVSCIMPTSNRRRYVPRAIVYFERQTHPNRELIIVDDGEDDVRDLVPLDPRVRYVRLDRPLGVGAKRNIACEAANGSIIAHWDDDDWASSDRLALQLESLISAEADVTGSRSVRFFDVRSGAIWRYEHPRTARPWAHGATLFYTRDFWSRHRFPNLLFGEDDAFVRMARNARLSPHDDLGLYVGLMHGGNTVRKRPHGTRWTREQPNRATDVMGEDGAFYDQLRAELIPHRARLRSIFHRRHRLGGMG